MISPALDLTMNCLSEQIPTLAAVQRSSHYLNAGRDPLLICLHRLADEPAFDHGIIICPPIGYEQVHSQRSLRILADELARTGFPVARFDWHGTGDSAGIDEDPHRYRTWLTNIGQLVRWMKAQLGCRKVSLIGLRLGATLATLSTAENEVDSMVLWAPVTKGRTFVREMKALSLTADSASARPTIPSTDIEAAGFILSSETAADLGRIDLSTFHPECRRLLVLSKSGMSDVDRLCQQWTSTGVRLQQHAVEGFSEMMSEPHRSEVPYDAIHQIVDWLAENSAVRSLRIDAQKIGPVETTLAVSHSDSDSTAQIVREQVLATATEPILSAIMTEPVGPSCQGRPTIVILNGGSAHRVGPNRINVTIARKLALEGFRTVRVDLAGFGDSVCDEADHEQFSHPYPMTGFRDIIRILKLLEKQGIKSFALLGLCSGAYFAFQSAVQIPVEGLVESILINPLTYFWRIGMKLDDSPTKHLRNFHYYRSSALSPRKWVKLLTGRSKIGLNGALALVARQLHLRSSDKSEETEASIMDSTEISHPHREDLASDLQCVESQGRTLAMFFAATDPGYGILTHHARREAKRLRNQKKLTIKMINDADHTFTSRSARGDLMYELCEYLKVRFPAKSN